MRMYLLLAIIFSAACVSPPAGSLDYKDVTVKWLGHSGFEISGTKKVYVNPLNYNGSATADFILLTDDDPGHCDPQSVRKLQSNRTSIFGILDCLKQFGGRINTLDPGEAVRYPYGLTVEAAHLYKLNESTKGIGFILVIDNVTIYHSGDTDFTKINDVDADIALLPIDDEAASTVAAKTIKPKIVVPMHYDSVGEANKFRDMLAGSGIDVRILTVSAV